MVEVPLLHPDPQVMYERNEPLPDFHPSVEKLLEQYLPPSHPTILDEMLRSPSKYPLPDIHPDLNSFLSYVSGKAANALTSSLASYPSFSVYSGHPDLDDYDEGDPVDGHPSIEYMFEPYLPDNHPNVDDLLREGQYNRIVSDCLHELLFYWGIVLTNILLSRYRIHAPDLASLHQVDGRSTLFGDISCIITELRHCATLRGCTASS